MRACLCGMDPDWPWERPKPPPVSPGPPLPPGAAPMLPTVNGPICDEGYPDYLCIKAAKTGWSNHDPVHGLAGMQK